MFSLFVTELTCIFHINTTMTSVGKILQERRRTISWGYCIFFVVYLNEMKS